MYERSAIVLERYLEKTCQLNKQGNLKANYNYFGEILEELEKFQAIEQEEEQKIDEFDKVANEIRRIQRAQEKLSKNNIQMEEEREKIFIDCIDGNVESTNKKLEKIEDNMQYNNKELAELKGELVKNLSELNIKQQERNKVSRQKRGIEANYLKKLDEATKEVESIDVDDVKKIKSFINSEDEEKYEEEVIEIMIKNGKGERIGFDEEVIRKAVKTRIPIAKKELECYVVAYDKMKRLLLEINNENLRIGKYQKVNRELGVKTAFYDAEKRYITSFLDNERMSVVNGASVHKQLMEEACDNFEADIEQIENLYELLMKESAGKATRKAYKELYDKNYLQRIEDKEKNFERELNNIKVNVGSIINSNYWRTVELKNIYEVFQKEVSEKFEKDLSEYGILDSNEIEEDDDFEDDFDIIQEKIKDKKNEKKKKSLKRDEIVEDDIIKTIYDGPKEENKIGIIDDSFDDIDEYEEKKEEKAKKEINKKVFEDDYDEDYDDNDFEDEDYDEDYEDDEFLDEINDNHSDDEDFLDEEFEDEDSDDIEEDDDEDDYEDDYDVEEDEDEEDEDEEDEDEEDEDEEDEDEEDDEEDDDDDNDDEEDDDDEKDDDDEDDDEEEDDDEYVDKKKKKKSKKSKKAKEKKKEGKGLKGLFGNKRRN